MQRTRTKSPLHGLSPNTGPLATAAWCVSRGLFPKDRNWFVEVALHADVAKSQSRSRSRFAIEVYGAEWGFAFEHESRLSWIRVTDIPFVHGQDDFQLLHETTSLLHISSLLQHVEHLHGLAFARDQATVRTSIEDAEPSIRAWLRSL